VAAVEPVGGESAVAIAPRRLDTDFDFNNDRRRKRTADRKRVLAGAGYLVLGTAFVFVASAGLDRTNGFVRVGLGLLGAVVLFRAIDLIATGLRGPDFDTGVWLCGLWLVVLVASAIAADWLPLAESRDTSRTLLTPTLLRPDLFSRHPLGTDRQGLDILGELVHGARVSLVVGVGAVAIGMIVGGVIGVTAGFRRGKLDASVGVLTDSMLAFPPLIFLAALAALVQPNVVNVTLALALLSVPSYIRISRASTMTYAGQEFVMVARAMGATNRRIVLRELVPVVAPSVASFGFIVLGVVIVAEAGLSFLGLSIKRPNPTWGNMIAAGQNDLNQNPSPVVIPCVALVLTVYAFNRIGDKSRRLWDPLAARDDTGS
jgi:peptide/nickel transport system permease protein